ncbi:hypothetical protein [Bacillus altitudinis]|uniref:hypothetical protein n=1 Tax=Bacillus altitudinis TaxID=293387 RepID=UPI0011A58F23|nr:hypothetical protein [Bacillus altitudinis]
MIDESVKKFIRGVILVVRVVGVRVMVFGGFGVYGGKGIGGVVVKVLWFSGRVGGGLIGMGWEVVVMLGMDWGVVGVILNNIGVDGKDDIKRVSGRGVF